MDYAGLLDALAEALDTASASLRTRSAIVRAESEPASSSLTDPLTRARAIHPQLGPRQAEVIEVLAEAGRLGTNTGVISRTIEYDQPNVYLTLRGLITLGFVQKDETSSPHTYRLTPILTDEPPHE